jgi:tetratricopeptide (TPR) repeat protein
MRKIENEALAEFSEALKLEPPFCSAARPCYMLTRLFDPALADIDQALEIEPNNVRSNIVFFSGAPPGCW